MKNLKASERVASTNNPKNRRPKKGIGTTLIIIAVVLGIGILSFTIFPAVALYMGLITGDQYVQIATKFFEFGFKVVESGASIIPSIIPTR